MSNNQVVFQRWRDAVREAHQPLFEQREDRCVQSSSSLSEHYSTHVRVVLLLHALFFWRAPCLLDLFPHFNHLALDSRDPLVPFEDE